MAQSLWRRVEKTESCWLWTGPVNSSGYGSVFFSGHKTGAHRASYEIAYGPFDKRLCVLHHCDNPRCVRPDHLWLGTRSDNMKDCAAKGRNTSHYRWTTDDNPNKEGKPFTIVDPQGNVIRGRNLNRFCRERGLLQGALWQVISGRIKQHRGFTRCAKYCM